MVVKKPSASPCLTRRAFIGTVGAGLLAGVAVRDLAWAAPVAAQPGQEAAFAAFMTLSALLTGHTDLDPVLGQEAFTALTLRYPTFQTDVQSLLAFVQSQGADAASLQELLDAGQAALATIPRQVVSAWYLGVVGEFPEPPPAAGVLTPPTPAQGMAGARVVAWEQAMMFVPVSDILPIPSYCGGRAGFWSDPPA